MLIYEYLIYSYLYKKDTFHVWQNKYFFFCFTSQPLLSQSTQPTLSKGQKKNNPNLKKEESNFFYLINITKKGFIILYISRK